MTTPTRRERISTMRVRSRRERMIQDRLLAVTLGVGGWLASTWVLMITIGNVHAWWHFIPSVGFAPAGSVTLWPFIAVMAATLWNEIFKG